MAWQEGLDGRRIRYREHLYPRWWVWLAAWGFVGMVSLAYGHAFGPTGAWATAVVGTLGVTAWLVTTSAVVSVDERVFRAGRARLPLEYVGRVRALDQADSIAARTTMHDPAAYLLLRTWTTPRSVLVEVRDPADPHPYWLISAKHPDRLANALRQAVEESSDTGSPATKEGLL